MDFTHIQGEKIHANIHGNDVVIDRRHLQLSKSSFYIRKPCVGLWKYS